MIKDWLKFNESNSSNSFKEEINKIRKFFMEYEDDDIVSYEMYVCGFSSRVKERDMLWSVNPNNGNFERWVDSQTEEANRYLDNESYRQLFLRTTDLDKYPFVFCADIKIKSENSVLDDFGVDKLKDVLVTWDRLKDDYDKVLIDLNSQHKDYKPMMIKIYFNPIVY
jgi:hypothetical protein